MPSEKMLDPIVLSLNGAPIFNRQLTVINGEWVYMVFYMAFNGAPMSPLCLEELGEVGF